MNSCHRLPSSQDGGPERMSKANKDRCSPVWALSALQRSARHSQGFCVLHQTPTFTQAHLSPVVTPSPSTRLNLMGSRMDAQRLCWPTWGCSAPVLGKADWTRPFPGAPASHDLPWRTDSPEPCSGLSARPAAPYGLWGWRRQVPWSHRMEPASLEGLSPPFL